MKFVIFPILPHTPYSLLIFCAINTLGHLYKNRRINLLLSFLLCQTCGQSKNPLEVSWFITGKIVLVQKYNNYSTMFKNNNFVLTHRGFSTTDSEQMGSLKFSRLFQDLRKSVDMTARRIYGEWRKLSFNISQHVTI